MKMRISSQVTCTTGAASARSELFRRPMAKRRTTTPSSSVPAPAEAVAVQLIANGSASVAPQRGSCEPSTAALGCVGNRNLCTFSYPLVHRFRRLHVVFHSMRHCIFCGDRANSYEHVWPKWILEFGSTEAGIAGDPVAWIPGPNASLRTKRVCRHRCNNGWMSRLEDNARSVLLPLMRDLALELDPEQQSIIARWTIKTVMVVECLNPKDIPPFYTADERRALMDKLTIPSGTILWAGRYTGRLSPTTAGIELGNVGEKDSPPTGVYFTLTAGRLALQIITLRPEDYRPIRIRVNPGDWVPASLLQVWPPQRVVRWPPRLSFGDRGRPSLRALVERFWTDNPSHPLWRLV
jgi:hypothetical protein